ncbi:MAG: hypothetical protein JOZ69_17925 [Myxococcales bacterium]|nr:hypothetical protein [Myxococcales bacterium]
MLRARLGCFVCLLAFSCVRSPDAAPSLPGPHAPGAAPSASDTREASGDANRAASRAIPVAFGGAGSLEAHAAPGTRAAAAAMDLVLERVRVDAETAGDAVETTVEHVFRNDSDAQLEGTFRFPLPGGAILTGLALEIDGRLVPGELVEKEKARKAYEQVVDRMRDPALLEWQAGEAFKLRVFPIEPHRTKRVELRFVTALHATSRGVFWAVRLPEEEAGHPAPKTTFRLDGRPVDVSLAVRGPSGERLVPVAAAAPEVVAETTAKGTYFHARLHPFAGNSPAATAFAASASASVSASAPTARAPQALIVLCDRSRSMLEARAEQSHLAAMLLDALAPEDHLGLLAGDVRARALAPGLLAAGDPAARAAVASLDETEPDGASDLGALLSAGGAMVAAARAQGSEPAVVYLGDAGATWGETRALELERRARESLAGAPLHVVLLGKTTDPVIGQALASGTHGRLLRPRTEQDARRAAEQVVRARLTPRLDDVRLLGAEGVDVPRPPPPTIFADDEVSVAAFVPAGVASSDLSFTGSVGGRTFTAAIPLSHAVSAKHVAERWAAAKIADLERDPAGNKEAIVRASLEGGVMSRFTSFLVLESEQAYERLQIERRAKPAPADQAAESGDDPRADDDASASVTPDHLQPGDPEVRVRAPADAESVVVVFPSGETKVAAYEGTPDDGAWVVRFLVDRHTPDGRYELLVRVTHAGGRVELLKLPYVVDTSGPRLRVSVRPRRGGGYTISATQELTREEMAEQRRALGDGAAGAGGVRAAAADDRAIASVLTDAKRVEVRAPDGQVLSLTHVRLGEFAGAWTPRDAASAHGRLRVVAVDRALNESITEVDVP